MHKFSICCASSQKLKKKKSLQKENRFFHNNSRVPSGDALGGAFRSLSTLDSGKCLRNGLYSDPPGRLVSAASPRRRCSRAHFLPGWSWGSVSPPGAPRPLCGWPGRRAAAPAPPATRRLPCCPRGGGERRGTGRGFPRTAHCRPRRKFLEGQGRCWKSSARVFWRRGRTVFARHLPFVPEVRPSPQGHPAPDMQCP